LSEKTTKNEKKIPALLSAGTRQSWASASAHTSFAECLPRGARQRFFQKKIKLSLPSVFQGGTPQ
jgi:hypothetical protein